MTLLDRARFSPAQRQENHSVVADALALPFGDGAFDLVSCSLFAHHLERAATPAVRPREPARQPAGSVNQRSHPSSLASALWHSPGFPLMRSRVAWLDGLTSVRRAYVPEEIRNIARIRYFRANGADRDLAQLSFPHGSDRVEVAPPIGCGQRVEPRRGYRTTSTSRILSRARKNLIEAKSRKRVSMWRLLKTRCNWKPSVMAV